MSRRSDRKADARGGAIEHLDGMVRLDCPHGHAVGWLWRPYGRGVIVAFDRERTAGQPVTEWPLRLTCTSCRLEGRTPDLRLSQDRAAVLLAQVVADTACQTLVHILGG